MGITILYRGKLNNINLLPYFLGEVEDIARDMNWKYHLLDNDLNLPNTARFEDNEITGHLPLKGISLSFHPKSESLSFYFDKDGNIRNLLSMVFENWENEKYLSDFVKTQFAPIEIHMTIIKLLKYIKQKYITNLEVIDEGGYWETEDVALLKSKFNYLNTKMDEVTEVLNNIEIDGNEAVFSILKKLENIFKERLKYKDWNRNDTDE